MFWSASTRQPLELEQQVFELLSDSQYWPPERMRDYQRGALEPLLRFARAEVPFYRQRLAPLFSSDGEIRWDNWSAVPILKRNDIVASEPHLRADTPIVAHGALQRVTTTGTSGTPITVMQTRLMLTATRASVLRNQGWHGLDWRRPLLFWVSENAGHCVWPDGCRYGPWGPAWLGGAPQYALDRSVSAEHVLEYLARNGIHYLSTRAKAAQELALELRRVNGRMELGGVLAFSTAVLPDEREDVRERLGCEIISQYASKEAGAIACQCPSGEHLHVNADTVLVEIVDDAGQACAPGELGRVIVTPLYNSVQPLIRYDQGDLAIAGGPCSCGRTLPVLQSVAGRTMNLFRFPDGRKIAPSMPDGLRQRIGAQFWQFAQIGPLDIEVRYVPYADAGKRWDEASVVEAVRLRMHPDANVTFRPVAGLVAGHGQKFVEYVCELAADG